MGWVGERLRGAIGRASPLLAIVAAWIVWVLGTLIWSDATPRTALPYLHAPILVVAGIAAGQILARRWRDWFVPEISAAIALILVVSLPFYANAQGAVGLQLAAVAGLVVVTAQEAQTEQTGPRKVSFVVGTDAPTARRAIALTLTLVAGAFLAARSQAAGVLVVVLVVAGGWAVVRGSRVPRRRAVGAGVVAFALAAVGVAALGALESWPAALARGGSLSSARHTLWADALELWSRHPVAGAGPGAFTEFSELASSRPGLERVHSSVLQVGAELGAVGVVLFVAMFLAGLLVATRGTGVGGELGRRLSGAGAAGPGVGVAGAGALVGPGGLIAATAWTALAVHSMIDHLYEFPAVTLAAGVVLGWGSASAGDRVRRM